MKKILTITLLMFSLAIFADRDEVLKIYNWADYISPEVLNSFPEWYYQHTGETVELIYNTFDVNENMLTQIEMGKEDYDVICPSEYIIDRMLKNNLLQKIDFTEVPENINYFGNVSEYATNKFRQMSDSVDVKDYAVGYMWGTAGWLYNADKVNPDEIDSWSAINNPKFKNEIYMKDAYRDIYSVIVLYAYKNDIDSGLVTRDELIQHITKERIDSVKQILVSAKQNFKGWEVDFGKEEMVKGDALLNLSWSGDAQWAIQEAEETDVKLGYIIPKEGSNVWFDGWCIPIYAVNKRAAIYFIDYMCRPDNAIKNMEEIGYVSVIATPEILEWAQDSTYPATDASYLFGDCAKSVHLNPVMYPDRSVIDRCSLMKDAGDINRELINMWNAVKGDNLNPLYLVLILVIILSAIIWLSIRYAKKHKENQAKKSKKKKK